MSEVGGNRPYQDHSDLDIHEEIRRLKGEYRHWSKKYDSAQRRMATDEYDGFNFDMRRVSDQIGKLQDELRIRRQIRAQEREGRSSAGDLGFTALSNWFKRMGLNTPPSESVGRVYYFFDVQGRRYCATYSIAERGASYLAERFTRHRGSSPDWRGVLLGGQWS